MHLFRDCPNKADLAVWQNFQCNLQAYKDNKKQQDYSNWKQEGYPSKQAAEYVKQRANIDTNPGFKENPIQYVKG